MTAALFALVCLIWGSTWLAIKIGLDGVPPFLGAGLRFALASAVMWGLALAARKPLVPSPKGRRAALCAGILSFGASYALVYWSETRVASGLVAVFYSLMPLITALLTAFVTRTETLSAPKAVGIAVGTAGVVALFWPEHGTAGADALGLVAAFLSAAVAAVNLVCQSLWGKQDDARVLNAWAMSIGTAILLALSLVFERGAALRWTPAGVGAIVYLAVCGSVVTFLSYYQLIRALPATHVSLITLVFPAVALLLGVAVGGETLSSHTGVGIALIFAGVGLALGAARLKAGAAKPSAG